MIPRRAVSVSATVFHKYTPLSTGWKSNTNMTGRERGRGSEKNICSEGDKKLCTNSRGLKDVLGKDDVHLESSEVGSSIHA